MVVKVFFNPLDEVEPRFLVSWSQEVEFFFVRHVEVLFFAISQSPHDLLCRWVEFSSQFCLEGGAEVRLLDVASENYGNVFVFQAHCKGLINGQLDFITIFIVTIKVVFLERRHCEVLCRMLCLTALLAPPLPPHHLLHHRHLRPRQ